MRTPNARERAILLQALYAHDVHGLPVHYRGEVDAIARRMAFLDAWLVFLGRAASGANAYRLTEVGRAAVAFRASEDHNSSQ